MRRLTDADESYGHQLVAPGSEQLYGDVNWQERCYHLLYLEPGLMLNIGRSVWPGLGVARGFFGIADAATMVGIRTERPFAVGGDPDRPDVGAVRVAAVEPLRKVRLSFEDQRRELAVDLEYSARFEPVATTPLLIEQAGMVRTHYMNFFQSGFYDGSVVWRGQIFDVQRRAGFRDRGWGVRKHDGAPRRGLVLAAFCEMPDYSVYLLLFETAAGRRVLSDGWIIGSAGADESIVSIEHVLEFEGVSLQAGALTLSTSGGGRFEVTFEVDVRLYLVGVGYSADPARQAAGVDVFDLADDDQRAELAGQTDHGVRFRCGGETGHGYVEVGLGTHRRYRPEDDASV